MPRPGKSVTHMLAKHFWLGTIAALAIWPEPVAAANQDCAPCHAAIYRRYLNSPMAATSGKTGAELPRESFGRSAFLSPGGSAKYEVTADDRGLSLEFSSGDIQGRRRLDYFVGSGVVGRSFITSVDGFLFQSPASYYSKPAAWALSPGYEQGETVNLTREIEPGCLNCHASGIRAKANTSNGYEDPPFTEAAVTCERCHGPGQRHIALMRKGDPGGRGAIVQPARLEGKYRSDICAQCHLPGAVEIVKGGAGRSYTPGQLLDDSVAVFVWAASRRATTVNGHFEQLVRSACRIASGDRMWCGACHDPHASVPAVEKASYFRAKCLTCHTVSSCRAPHNVQIKAAGGCIECHMPRSSAATVQHAAYTDHTIPRWPRRNVPVDIPADARLVPFEGFAASERELGLAYATVAVQDGNRAWGLRGFELLRKVNASSPGDVRVASKLAELYDRMGQNAQACKLYAQVAASGAATPAVTVNHGSCLGNQGDLTGAMQAWADVLKRNPTVEAARLNLAVAQFRSGRVAEARANLQELLRLDPASRRARQLLTEMQAP